MEKAVLQSWKAIFKIELEYTTRAISPNGSLRLVHTIDKPRFKPLGTFDEWDSSWRCTKLQTTSLIAWCFSFIWFKYGSSFGAIFIFVRFEKLIIQVTEYTTFVFSYGYSVWFAFESFPTMLNDMKFPATPNITGYSSCAGHESSIMRSILCLRALSLRPLSSASNYSFLNLRTHSQVLSFQATL